MLRRSTRIGCFSASLMRSRSSARNASHSVTMDEGVGALGAGIGILAVLDAFEDVLGLVHAFGIVGPDSRAAIGQAGDDREGRGLAHVVGVRLEGEPEDRDGLAAHAAFSGVDALARHGALALIVHGR